MERVTPAFDGLPQSYADRVIGLITQHVKSQPPTPKKQTVRLYAESGSAARISIHEFVESTPKLINADLTRSLVDQEIESRRRLNPELRPEAKTVQVTMIVATDGSAEDVRVGRSPGDIALDRVASRIAAQMRFAPATLDEVPVRIKVTMPISFPF